MRKLYWQVGLAASLSTVAALLAACGGGSSGGGGGGGLYTGKTTQATVSEQSVKDALGSVKEVLPSCTATGVAKVVAVEQDQGLASALKVVKLTLQQPTAKKVGKTVALIPSTQPQSATGTCGGSISYPTWSHSSGTTTIAVKFDNYCTKDSSNNSTTINGTLSAVDAGTPTNSGPVTNKFTANIPLLTVVEKNSAGTVTASESISLTGFEYVPQTGVTPSLTTLAGTFKMGSLEVKDDKNSKSYKVENVNVTTGAAGSDMQVTVSARIFRGTSGYSDITTNVPLVVDSSQKLKSGEITFTGAGNSKATLTAVPGSSGEAAAFTVKVNDTPLSGAKLSCGSLL